MPSEWLLTLAMSTLPSRLKSPTATESGRNPARKLVAVPKLGEGHETLHVFSSTDTLLESALTTARSEPPSRLKSPTASLSGNNPTGKSVAVAKPPLPLPSNTDTLLDLAFEIARSELPSRLKSPTATPRGLVPTAKLVALPKPPLPFPSNTATLLEPLLTTARSGLPSRLKSSTATE